MLANLKKRSKKFQSTKSATRKYLQKISAPLFGYKQEQVQNLRAHVFRPGYPMTTRVRASREVCDSCSLLGILLFCSLVHVSCIANRKTNDTQASVEAYDFINTTRMRGADGYDEVFIATDTYSSDPKVPLNPNNAAVCIYISSVKVRKKENLTLASEKDKRMLLHVKRLRPPFLNHAEFAKTARKAAGKEVLDASPAALGYIDQVHPVRLHFLEQQLKELSIKSAQDSYYYGEETGGAKVHGALIGMSSAVFALIGAHLILPAGAAFLTAEAIALGAGLASGTTSAQALNWLQVKYTNVARTAFRIRSLTTENLQALTAGVDASSELETDREIGVGEIDEFSRPSELAPSQSPEPIRGTPPALIKETYKKAILAAHLAAFRANERDIQKTPGILADQICPERFQDIDLGNDLELKIWGTEETKKNSL